MKKVRIGIVGCGAIGRGVASFVDRELKDKAKVWALTDKEEKKASCLAKSLKKNPKILNLDTLIKEVDLVIEAASQEAAKLVLRKVVALKKDVVILSIGALWGEFTLLKQAEKRGVKIYVPSGAICGVDGLGALGLGKIRKISLITSKSPQNLLGVEYLKKKKIDLKGLRKEKIIFKGKVEEAIRYFPHNINVAATILLASSFKDVGVWIKACPNLKRNVHHIEIEAKEAKVTIEIENVPSELNPKTSTLAILSTQNLLKKIFSSFKIGS